MKFVWPVLLLSAVVLFGIDVGTVIPKTAHVVVEMDGRTYFSDRCVSASDWDQGKKFTVEEAKRLGFKGNEKCRDAGGFSEERKLFFHLLGVRPVWQ